MFAKLSTTLQQFTRRARQADAQAEFAVTEKLISPNPHYLAGRSISVCIDSNFLLLSAASNFAGRSRVLALRKLPIAAELSEKEKETFIKNAIAEFYGTYGRRSAEVILSVSGQHTSYRTFTLPALSRNDLKEAVRFEAARQVPFALDEAVFDFRLISKISIDGGQRYKIAVQAATRKFIEQQLGYFSALGIPVTTVHFTHDAVGQLLRSLPGYKDDNEYTLLRLNRSQLEIAFYRGANLELLHQISLDTLLFLGWSDFIDVESISTSMAQEISTALDFYSGQFSKSGNTNVFAYGDLSGSDQLIEQLELKTGLDIRRFPTGQLTFLKGQDPFFSNNMRESLPVVASCFCSYRLASLLPPERKAVVKLRKQNRLSALAFGAVLITLFVVWSNARKENQTIQTKLTNMQHELETAKGSTANAAYALLQSQIASNKKYFDQIETSIGGPSLNLKSLSYLTPTGIQLTSFEYEPDKSPENLILQGIVRSSTVPPELILANYVQAVTKNRYFEHVRLVQYSKKKTDDGFDLQFSIAMEGVQ